MSRSGYSEDCDDQWATIRWRGAVKSAIRGRKGQAFLKELVSSLDALPEKKLIADELDHEGAVCAIGSVGKFRGLDMQAIDPHDPDQVAEAFGIAPSLAREIVYENDEAVWNQNSEARFERMKRWAETHILASKTPER